LYQVLYVFSNLAKGCASGLFFGLQDERVWMFECFYVGAEHFATTALQKIAVMSLEGGFF